MIIADTPQKIELYRMHVLEKMLKLEIRGIKMNKGGQPTAYSAIKREYNLKGSRQKVWDTFKEIIEITKQEQKGEA
tara:strand:- start:232 stop:459 length:228 start_codon:yes stop_codon:yes gene_type:complete